MTTPSALQAAVTAAGQALAVSDLAALQTFQTLATTGTTTIAQLQAGFATLLASLGDPGRIAAVQASQGQYQAFVGSLNTLISQTNYIANQPV